MMMLLPYQMRSSLSFFLSSVVVVSLLFLVSVSSQVCVTPPVCPSTVGEVVPNAWYNLTFSSSPSSVSGFGWNLTDPYDTSCSYQHRGLLRLTGGLSNVTGGSYVDLNAGTSNSYNGLTVPTTSYIGSSSIGSVSIGTAGWSFEVTFKALNQTSWAKIYCIGNGAGGSGSADIILGWNGNSREIDFTVFDIAGNAGNFIVVPPSPGLVLGQYYHIIAVIQQLPETAGFGNWFIYVNVRKQFTSSIYRSITHHTITNPQYHRSPSFSY